LAAAKATAAATEILCACRFSTGAEAGGGGEAANSVDASVGPQSKSLLGEALTYVRRR